VWASRYHKKGQAKQKRKIKNAVGHYFYRFGALLTLTFDHKRFSRLHAWNDLGYKVRDFVDRLNKWRVSHGLSKVKGYLHVNECQPQSDYPAPHIVFPGLKWVAPQKVLAELWGSGFIDVRVGGSINPAKYACKYIT
jgi:hypothetical protein